MSVRTGTLLSGIVGGVAWLLRWSLDVVGAGEGLLGPLYWTGFVLLAVALAGLGVGLVSADATWLRAIVAVAFPLLLWSVLEVADPGTDATLLDGLVGLGVAATSARVLRQERPEPSAARRGAHAR